MLIDELLEFCNTQYDNYGALCGCKKCNHPSGECSGECRNCLYQIHYPGRFNGQLIKKTYDCPKMMYQYVCQYTYIYSSEILYAFNAHKDFLSDYKKFKIMSIACGACPDLIALETFKLENNLDSDISYKGYDINPLWSPIHSFIKQYCSQNGIHRSLLERDVITYFQKYYVQGTNIIVISYLLSYLYNTNQTDQIDLLFDNIANNVVMRKNAGEKMLIIINDVNSNRRGRNYFNHLPRIMRKNGMNVKSRFRFFDSPALNYFQRLGAVYPNKKCLFIEDDAIKKKHHIDSTDCRSIQLIMEVT